MATFYIAVKTQVDYDALRKMHGNQQHVNFNGASFK